MKISLEDWKNLDYSELKKKYNISLEEIYEIVLSHELYKYSSVIEKRKISEIEEKYIYRAKDLTVRELSNMFHKSYNAMLIQVKMLGYYDRISSKK